MNTTGIRKAQPTIEARMDYARERLRLIICWHHACEKGADHHLE